MTYMSCNLVIHYHYCNPENGSRIFLRKVGNARLTFQSTVIFTISLSSFLNLTEQVSHPWNQDCDLYWHILVHPDTRRVQSTLNWMTVSRRCFCFKTCSVRHLPACCKTVNIHISRFMVTELDYSFPVEEQTIW